MASLSSIGLVAFDMFGTLARNEMDEWSATVHGIAREQSLGVDGPTLWTEWRRHEIEFRKTRTNMQDPDTAPTFRTYWEAWRDAFAAAFASLGVRGDPEDAPESRRFAQGPWRIGEPDAVFGADRAVKPSRRAYQRRAGMD